MAFNKDEMKEILRLLQEQGKMQDHLNESMRNYTDHLKKIAEMQKNIKHISEQVNKLKSEENNLTDELKSLIKERNKGSQKEIEARRKEIKLNIDKIKAKRISVELTEKQLASLKEVNKEYVEQAQNVNKINLGLKEGAKFLKAVLGLINKGYGKFKSFGLFDMEKAARMAAHEMGVVSKNAAGFRQNLYNAAETTLNMGVGVKDLAKMQGAYSNEVGKATQLSEQGLNAMAEIAAGTMLGAEGAAQIAAAMERFNVSAVDARDLVEETVKMAGKMGVNSNKVLKSLQNNLKMANRYHFKGGIKGMAKMAAMAEKFNISMEATAGMADQLFDIEGAVEMAAKLNTMGGEWSKLGDPMKLMYQARNDMEGLQESVINATAGMADFNKETGEFEFSGLELHRMRELEKITGISAEQMAEMAKQKAKFEKVGSQMAGSGISDDMKEFVEANAQFNKNSRKFEIKLEGSKEAIPVDQLNKTHEKMMIDTQASLKERAEQTQTFDDLLNNTIEMFKVAMLPILEGINEQMPAIRKLIQSLKDNGWIDKLKGFAQKIGNIAGTVMGLIMEFPKTFAAILMAGPLLSAAKWFINGIQLGRGFLSTTGGGMFGGGGGGGFGGAGDFASGGSLYQKGGYYKDGKRWTGKGKIPKGAKYMKGGLTSMGKGLGIGALGMIGGMAMDYGREQMDNPDSGQGKALGVASGALGGAATGAMIGSVVPVIGTAVGAIVGGLVGGIWSAVEEFGGPATGYSSKAGAVNDAVLADGKITPIDSKDKVFEISKAGGAYDKATNSSPGAGSAPSSVKVHISFDELKVTSGGGVGKIDLESDSAFMRELATKVKEALSKTANGGVLSPNPS